MLVQYIPANEEWHTGGFRFSPGVGGARLYAAARDVCCIPFRSFRPFPPVPTGTSFSLDNKREGKISKSILGPLLLLSRGSQSGSRSQTGAYMSNAFDSCGPIYSTIEAFQQVRPYILHITLHRRRSWREKILPPQSFNHRGQMAFRIYIPATRKL